MYIFWSKAILPTDIGRCAHYHKSLSINCTSDDCVWSNVCQQNGFWPKDIEPSSIVLQPWLMKQLPLFYHKICIFYYLYAFMNSQKFKKKITKVNLKSLKFTKILNNFLQWKRISCKPSARWQHLSRLKASAFFSL